jgi:hypothetical protein
MDAVVARGKAETAGLVRAAGKVSDRAAGQPPAGRPPEGPSLAELALARAGSRPGGVPAARRDEGPQHVPAVLPVAVPRPSHRGPGPPVVGRAEADPKIGRELSGTSAGGTTGRGATATPVDLVMALAGVAP